MNFILISQEECSSPELAGIIQITKKVFELIELIAPLTLIVMVVISLFLLMMNPEDKKGLSKLKNSITACVIIFFIPVVANLVMTLVGNNFTISSCWNSATKDEKKSEYINPNENKSTSILIDPSEYQNGVSNNKNTE